MNVNIFAKANQIIKSCDTAYAGVIDENNYPSVSTVSPVNTENIFEVYFATGLKASKTKRIIKNNKVSVCFCKDFSNITLVGEAEIITDQPTKSRLWQNDFINHFPLGETDPNYCIIKLTTKRVSLWIDNESGEFTVDELLTVQSRCGLLCNGCSYKKSHGCGGCVQTNGNPFYGKCNIANCCQEKGYSHCGECSAIPCEQLYEYSYLDSEHGDKPPGARVEVCRAWACRK